MSEWKQVEYSFEPGLLDLDSSPTTVYERKNIQKIEINEENKPPVYWTAEERELTIDEYKSMQSPQMEQIMQEIARVELSLTMAVLGGI